MRSVTAKQTECVLKGVDNVIKYLPTTIETELIDFFNMKHPLKLYFCYEDCIVKGVLFGHASKKGF